MGAQGLRWWGSRFWTEPLFPEFIYGAMCFWRSWRRDSIPDLDLETYAPIVNTPSIKQLIRSHHPSLRASLFCSNISTTALSAVNASCFWPVILTHGYMTDLHFFSARESVPSFLWALSSAAWSFARFLPVNLCLCIGCRRRRLFFFFLILISVSRYSVMGETAQVSLEHCFFLPSIDRILPLSSQRGLSFLCDPWKLLLYPQFHFELWSFAFSSSDQFVASQMSSVFGTLVAHFIGSSLGHTKPIQSEDEQNPAVLTCTNLPRPFMHVLHLLTIELGPIVHRNPGRCRSADVHWTIWDFLYCFKSSGWTEMLVDKKNNLSPT